MKISERTIVVTGASSGIGEALALELATRGASLALVARDLEALERLRLRIGRESRGRARTVAIRTDVSDREAVRRALEEASARLGLVEVLINNAAISLYGPLTETPIEDTRRLLEVNLFGPLYGMLEAIPSMRAAGGGRIVNILSAAGLYGVPYLGAYGASKAALAAVGQSLRAELAGTGIGVLNVYPGYTRTPLFLHEKRVGAARRPRTRYADPRRVARAIARAIENDRNELYLSTEGRLLARARGLAPSAVDRTMRRIAARLATPVRRPLLTTDPG